MAIEVFIDQGRSAEAEPLYQRALTMREQIRGPHHDDTATTLDNLAMLYYAQEPIQRPSFSLSGYLKLAEYPPVVFSNEFRGEETEQRYDSKGEGQPIETCIEWNTKYCTCKRKDCTHNCFIEQVRKEQDEEQTTYCAEKECFTPDRHAPIKH